jgi:hypothetical protein
MSYDTDGKCHNANRGTFNHECGKPATWIGTRPDGYRSGFCDKCKESGDERHPFKQWERIADWRAGTRVIVRTTREGGHVADPQANSRPSPQPAAAYVLVVFDNGGENFIAKRELAQHWGANPKRNNGGRRRL